MLKKRRKEDNFLIYIIRKIRCEKIKKRIEEKEKDYVINRMSEFPTTISNIYGYYHAKLLKYKIEKNFFFLILTIKKY